MAADSSILSWRIPWTGLVIMESQSPWVHRELGMTEQLTLSTQFSQLICSISFRLQQSELILFPCWPLQSIKQSSLCYIVVSYQVSVLYICLVAQLRPTLCDPMDCSPPCSYVRAILQARILQWVVISFSRESSRPRDQICISCIGRWILYHCATWEALY